MKKDEMKTAEKGLDLLDNLQAQKTAQDEIEKAPLYLYFGAEFDSKFEVPIKQRITPKLIDSVTPIMRAYKSSMIKEFQLQMTKNGFITREKFDKQKANKEKDNDTLYTEYMAKFMIEAKDMLTNDEKFIENSLYTLDEFELVLSGKNGFDNVQKGEDYKLNIEFLHIIIDMSEISAGVKFAPLKGISPVPEIMSSSDSDFWQNQDVSEVARIVTKFRKDYI